MNNVCIIGRLTKDLEVITSQSGTTVGKTSIAVNRKFKKEETDFINLIAFNKTAELMSQYLGKGSQVGIEGRIQTGSYENKEGKKVYTFDVVVDNITFIDNKKEGSSQISPYDIPVAKQVEENDPYSFMGEQISLDDDEDID